MLSAAEVDRLRREAAQAFAEAKEQASAAQAMYAEAVAQQARVLASFSRLTNRATKRRDRNTTNHRRERVTAR